ncbi:MAG: glycosyltransferase family A protein, partial [Saccharolobus sp.]
MPLATILITSFEQRPFLMDAIMSATNQTVENLEIILVTKFDAKSILSQSLTKDLRYFEVKDAKTKGALIKYGLKRARTDIIMFLDDDDVFYPDKAEYII